MLNRRLARSCQQAGTSGQKETSLEQTLRVKTRCPAAAAAAAATAANTSISATTTIETRGPEVQA